MITVENLEKSFHDKKILKGISCSFKKGETSLIIGQTGAGKTVFLKIDLIFSFLSSWLSKFLNSKTFMITDNLYMQ